MNPTSPLRARSTGLLVASNEDQQPVATRYAQRQLETHYLVAETSLDEPSGCRLDGPWNFQPARYRQQ
jgi:hypothetical protein